MTTATDNAGSVSGEQRMLIDGKLVEAKSGKLFDNINPATEEVLGQVADAGHEDMERRHRRGPAGLRRVGLGQRQEAAPALHRSAPGRPGRGAGALRAELVAEVGTPVLLTYGPQLDVPLAEGLFWPAAYIDEFPWERDLPIGTAFGSRSWRKVTKEPIGVVAAIVPVELPVRGDHEQARAALATGNTVILKAAPNTPWNATRIGRLVAEQTDFPPGVLQVVTTSDNLGGRGPGHRPPGRPHLVHRFDRGRPPDHGEGCPDPEAPLPRAGRQVGRHRPRRRRLRGEAVHGLDGLLARRAGLRHAHPDVAAPVALRRGHRAHR